MVAAGCGGVNRSRINADRSPLDTPPAVPHNAHSDPRHEGLSVKKSFWFGLAKYAVGLGLLGYVVGKNWPGENGLGEALARPIQWLPFATAGVLVASATLLTFYRWWMLVRALGMEFGVGSALRLGLVGFFFNALLPGGVGGDIVKAVGIAREQARRALAVSTVLFDRAVGLWALVWLVALSGGAYRLLGGADDTLLATNAGIAAIVRASWAVTAVTVVGWWALGLVSERRAHRFAARLATVPRAGRFLSECWRATWLYRKHPWAVAATLTLSIGIHAINVLAVHAA
jgi:glycosyltransferase 2 family protein